MSTIEELEQRLNDLEQRFNIHSHSAIEERMKDVEDVIDAIRKLLSKGR